MRPATPEEIEAVTACLAEGRELPAELRALVLGEDEPARHREYQLAYAGKRREEDVLADVPALPLQLQRSFGDAAGSWHNRLVQGDNLPVLRHLLELKKTGRLRNADGTDGIRLVYIDPPFATKQDFQNTKNGAVSYSDKVAGADFLESLRRRLILIRELLADNGTIFLHLDWRRAHYVRVLMDEVFGENRFINEIARLYAGGGQSVTSFPKKHEPIFWYARGPKWIFNADDVRVPYDSEYSGTSFKSDGTRAQGKSYKPNDKGKIPEDWWLFNRPYGKEIVGYPSQKPESLLTRIVAVASNPGDIVLDCFAGSGTTLTVAEKLGRRWIGVDLGKDSIYTIQKQLLTIADSPSLSEVRVVEKRAADPCCGKAECDCCSESCCANTTTTVPVAHGKPAAPFALYSLGHYDLAELKKLPFEQYRDFALQLFQAEPRPQDINGVHVDGRFRGDAVIVYDFSGDDADIAVGRDYFDDLGSLLKNKVTERVFFITPAASVDFLEDWVEAHGIRFYVMRVPYSVISEIDRVQVKRENQPMSAGDINKIVETAGFDFQRKPSVTIETYIGSLGTQSEQLDLDQAQDDKRILRITSFRSNALVKQDLSDEDRSFNALAMVMIDYDHDGEVFDLDEVLYADALQKHDWTLAIDSKRLDKPVAVIYCDIFGNEKMEVLTADHWGAE